MKGDDDDDRIYYFGTRASAPMVMMTFIGHRLKGN